METLSADEHPPSPRRHTRRADAPRRRRFARDEYYRMADAGLFRGERVELINGEIVRMSPQTAGHAMVVELVTQALRRIERPGLRIRVQLPLAVGRRSESEPDVAVVKGVPRDSATEHPSTAALIVEVAVSSLAYDRKKAGLYAKAGVEEYWIVDVENRQMIVHRVPARMPEKAFKHGYREVITHPDTASVASLVAPQAAIQVAEMLP